MYGYIYKITNKVNNKIYIGKTIKTIEERFNQHILTAIKHRYKRSHFYDAINLYGENNFYVEELQQCDTKEELNQQERYWINQLNSRDQNIGYNIHEGGLGGKTYIGKYQWPENSKKAWYACQHLPASEKQKAMLSARRKNCIVSQETREKLRQKQLGRKYGEATIEKLRIAMTGERNPNYGGLSEGAKIKLKEASSNRTHIHKGFENMNVKNDVLQTYLNSGWELGYFKKNSVQRLSGSAEQGSSDSERSHTCKGDNIV